jgi:3-mercaptopyruvate sulfurtransferase SseA
VLDGGFDKWLAEGRPTETGPARDYPPARFTPSPRPKRYSTVTTLATTKEIEMTLAFRTA